MLVLSSVVGAIALALLPAGAQQYEGPPPDRAQAPDQDEQRRFQRKGPLAIPNHYIVVLDQDVSTAEADAAATAALVAFRRATDPKQPPPARH